jgi:hypothetical protein
MTTVATPEAVNIYFRFVDCCTNRVFEFRGSIPSFINNSVYGALVTNILTANNCYTVTQLTTQDSVFWSALPLISAEVISYTGGSDCKAPKCPTCEELCGECPEGYTQVGNECIQEETVPATYTGGLMTLQAGQNVTSYSNFGIRLYDDISSAPLPIIGNGTNNANFEVRESNGTGPLVPQLANVQSTLWGCSFGAPACTTGIAGGKLNLTGLWAAGYPIDTELCFEFCVDIIEEKQYIIGLGGDNSVKFYIDGNLTVSLIGNGAVTRPFNHWHAFPITLTAGQHTIRLCGVNAGGQAAFGAEIYDIDLITFQATLLDPAVGVGNCGNAATDTDPYVIFSTKDYIGQQIPNPALPGVWQCPDGSTPDYCTGIPQCTIEDKIPFPICPCYLLIPCDGTYLPLVSNSPELAAYINEFVSIQAETGEYYCVFVIDYTGEEVCETAIPVKIQDVSVCPCPPQCYFISNASGIVIVNSNELVELTSAETYPYVKICSSTYPLVDNTTDDYLIISLGDCIDGVCPQQCYKLVNCQDQSLVIYTNSDSVLPYLYGTNNVVKIIGRTGCWAVKELEDGEICDCPIDITITTSYATCLDCIGYTSYKLTACVGNDIIYTLDDLSGYINNTVKLNCGCYRIEELNILPPNPQSVEIEYVYNTCIECTRTYWKLTDCAGVAEDIFTYTDLSALEGSIIKIEGCDTCWQVEFAKEPSKNSTTVQVVLNFRTCEECNVDIPCQCSTISNLDLVPKTYFYLDCEYNYVEVTVPSGQTSDKVCAIKWLAKEYCDCFLLKLTIQPNPGSFVSQVFTATANGDMLNGYPVYDLCDGPSCGTVSFDGTNWFVYDENGAPVFILAVETSSSCPFGKWLGADGNPIPNTSIITYECNVVCNCIDFTITEGNLVTTINLTIASYDSNGYPIYTSGIGTRIVFNRQTGCWDFYYGMSKVPIASLCNEGECPIGAWNTSNPTRSEYASTNCTIPPINPELTSTDCIQIYGLCQFGVCPQPEIKNNRTVRPGYNTPGCDPDRYDEITCRFADIMYKIVLEKRYGITNCCPDDDEKWLLLKELIDLQALKDPNYICPDCPCTCNSGKSYSSCNCGN